jgi:uncharacterized protein
MRRVAVVGSGISGLAVAHGLAHAARVTLFEAGTWFGGHTNTVDVTLDGVTHGVDTGFLVFNRRTYPRLLDLFARLGVELAPSEMTFSVRVPDLGLEWSGSSFNTVFAQRRNLASARFLGMLADLRRFNRLTTRLAISGQAEAMDQPIGELLDAHRFGRAFRDWYFMPMVGSIWSCPTDQMLRFPVATMIRFCHNHGLLQIADRPQWYTVRGGARRYVHKMLRSIGDARLATPVRRVRRLAAGGAAVATDRGCEYFDEVVLACHADQALALLDDASAEERAVLGAVRYQPNRAVLHTDVGVLPTRRIAWAAWNYERAGDAAREHTAVCLHYLINKLQPLPFRTPVIVSLNPVAEPHAQHVLAEFDYAHPVFDQPAVAAQARLPALQGRGHTWFCGAWTRYGFHEDGLVSAEAVLSGLRSRIAAPVAEARAA